MSTQSKFPYEPSLVVRFLVWIGIYIAVQLPLLPYRSDLVYFPLGLLTPFILLADKITGAEIELPGWTLRVMYAFYIAHLAATLIVRRRKTFLILIWSLVALVLLNLAGCEIGQHTH